MIARRITPTNTWFHPILSAISLADPTSSSATIAMPAEAISSVLDELDHGTPHMRTVITRAS